MRQPRLRLNGRKRGYVIRFEVLDESQLHLYRHLSMCLRYQLINGRAVIFRQSDHEPALMLVFLCQLLCRLSHSEAPKPIVSKQYTAPPDIPAEIFGILDICC